MSGNTATVEVVWQGAEPLRELLVPVDALVPLPRNARRGDVGAIRASLRRFGQQRPLLVADDGTIVAGNHTFLAVREEGWSHVAAVRTTLVDDELDAYAIADNRTGDLAVFDKLALVELLRPFADQGRLAGLGFSADEVRALIEQAGELASPLDGVPGRLDLLGRNVQEGHEFALVYGDDETLEFQRLVALVAAADGTLGVAATVLAGMRRAESTL